MPAHDETQRHLEPLSNGEILEGLEKATIHFENKLPRNRYFEVVSTSHYILPDIEYFGAKHSFDSAHPQFASLDKSLTDFVVNTQNPIVLVESSLPAESSNLKDALISDGERGFVAALAREKGIVVDCLEPSRQQEVAFLEQYFSKDQIECYYFLRASRDYHRRGRGKDMGVSFDHFAEGILNSHKQTFGQADSWVDYDFSLKHFYEIYKDLFGTDFDYEDQTFLGKHVDPKGHHSVINMVSAKCDLFRDSNHINKIQEQLELGRQVFIVNGEEHAATQRSVLEKLTNTQAVILNPERYKVFDPIDAVKTFEKIYGTQVIFEENDSLEVLLTRMWEELCPQLDNYIKVFDIPSQKDASETSVRFMLRVINRLHQVKGPRSEMQNYMEYPDMSINFGEGTYDCVLGTQLVARICEKNSIPVNAGFAIGHMVAVVGSENGQSLYVDAVNHEIAELHNTEDPYTCLVGQTLQGREKLAFSRLLVLPANASLVSVIDNLSVLFRDARRGNPWAKQIESIIKPDIYLPYETAEYVFLHEYMEKLDSPEWLQEYTDVLKKRDNFRVNPGRRIQM
jgi:hypothetical protein